MSFCSIKATLGDITLNINGLVQFSWEYPQGFSQPFDTLLLFSTYHNNSVCY